MIKTLCPKCSRPLPLARVVICCGFRHTLSEYVTRLSGGEFHSRYSPLPRELQKTVVVPVANNV